MEDCTSVIQTENEDGFEEQLILPNKFTKRVKSFDKAIGFLKSKTDYFQDFRIGVSRKYDSNENVIEEVDWNKTFKFALQDLATKIRLLGYDIMSWATIL